MAVRFSDLASAIWADRVVTCVVGGALVSVLGTLGGVGYGLYRAYDANPQYTAAGVGIFVVALSARAALKRRTAGRKAAELDAALGAATSKQQPQHGGIFVTLMENEKQMLNTATPSIFSIFEAEDDEAAAAAKATVRNRVAEIVSKNPWIIGRLRTGPPDLTRGAGEPTIWIPAEDNAFFFGENSKFGGGAFHEIEVESEDDIRKKELPKSTIRVNVSEDLVDKAEGGQPVRFTLVTCRSNPRVFALTVSAAHIFCDSSTLYRLHNMLQPGENKVTALRVNRDPEGVWSMVNLGEGACRKFVPGVLSSTLGPLSQFFGWHHDDAYVNSSDPKRKQLCLFFKISKTWIAEEKKKHAARAAAATAEQHASASYVSTNDLLVSYWTRRFIATHKVCNYTLMVFDIRGRKKGITADLAGNYSDGAMLCEEEATDPLDVRRCVSSVGEWHGKSATDPTKPCKIKSPSETRRPAITSNWQTFYSELRLHPRVKHVAHVPAVSVDRGVIKPRTKECQNEYVPVMIIFGYGPDEEKNVGVLVRAYGVEELKGDMSPFEIDEATGLPAVPPGGEIFGSPMSDFFSPSATK